MVIHKMGKIGSCVAPLHAWAGSCLAAGWKEGSSGKMGGMSSRKVVGDRETTLKFSDGLANCQPAYLAFASLKLRPTSMRSSLTLSHCIYNTLD